MNSAVAENAKKFATFPISDIRVGVTLQTPIFDCVEDRDVLLLASGTTITENLLGRLQKRGISDVRVLQSELKRILAPDAKIPKAKPRPAAKHQSLNPETSFVKSIQRHEAASYSDSTAAKFNENFQQSLNQIEDMFDGLKPGDPVDGKAVAATSQQSINDMAEDFDLFVSMGVEPETDKYPLRHGFQVSMLAMSIGTTMGLRQADLIELSNGCLIHDVGMLHINQNLVHAERMLDEIEFLEITKHPTIAFDMLRSTRDISVGSGMVIFQMHERCNGSGYPRRREGHQIHQLARIAAVADVYLALVSARPHRPAMLPYFAIEQLIGETKRGLFDPNVLRALLQTISLFPIGSFVEVSDGRVGKTIRSNGDQYTRPVVELWQPQELGAEPVVVDLSEESELQITRPLVKLTARIKSADRDNFDDRE